MHPFGGTQICPRCSKAVYAAEQVMGPGRKLYHKPCLACTFCNKRLDSYTLLEHDQEPYCKPCHVRNFGTRDLRQANLPHRDITPPPLSRRSTSPLRATLSTPTRVASPPLRVPDDGVSNASGNTRRNGTLTTSPTSSSFPAGNSDIDGRNGQAAEDDHDEDANEARDTVDRLPASPTRASPFRASQTPVATPAYTGTPSNTGRPGLGNLPRTIPLTPARSGTYSAGASPARPRHLASKSLGGTPLQAGQAVELLRDDLGDGGGVLRPIMQTATGTRYGAALGGTMPVQLTGSTGSPRKWGATSATPSCPRCGKSVYFAEQVKAVGKTYHKNCLRCSECNTLLDSSRLRDHDGEPLCVRCYGKLHGPQGSGYALLGKAGG
ncbi:putative protein with zinc-binding domain present in Lin-11, Isl-1, Mec-3 [Lyophyllum shimeji]|uniref:Cysteine-rich protein 1 n=1 Tax=Lyophyllum shimeji TaxID=47721 RepID=A0A9P3UVF7_LYOSH|nr:putative protein with zinc-binding domain present in Lin-11, Isl-1, Mec-3 [Lyophyllum shimeji]